LMGNCGTEMSDGSLTSIVPILVTALVGSIAPQLESGGVSFAAMMLLKLAPDVASSRRPPRREVQAANVV
jgi:hypothetical protein